MEDFIFYIVFLLLAFWFLLTLLFQVDKFSLILSRYDIFRLIPRWTFFSPNPGQHDLHLLYRDKLSNGEYGSWKEVSLTGHKVIPPIWNPYKRLPKILWDCWASIQYLMIKKSVSSNKVQISGAYLILLNLSMRTKKDSGAKQRQFSLVRSQGFKNRKIEPLFVSHFHDFN